MKHASDVIILDVVTNKTAKIYRKALQAFSPKIVLLLPTFEETQKRLATRTYRIKPDEEKLIYQWEEELTDYDEKIDNTHLSPEKVVETISTFFL